MVELIILDFKKSSTKFWAEEPEDESGLQLDTHVWLVRDRTVRDLEEVHLFIEQRCKPFLTHAMAGEFASLSNMNQFFIQELVKESLQKIIDFKHCFTDNLEVFKFSKDDIYGLFCDYPFDILLEEQKLDLFAMRTTAVNKKKLIAKAMKYFFEMVPLLTYP